MIDLTLSCPDVAWPRRLNGCIVLGILLADSGPTAWVVFEAENGFLLSTRGFIGEGKDFLDNILRQPALIQASAHSDVWRSLENPDSALFFDNIKSGEVHISGDFRVFAKNAPLLIKMLEKSGIWNQLDYILDSLHQ